MMKVLGIILLNLFALHCNAASKLRDGPDIVDVESPMSSLMRIFSAFDTAPIEPQHVLSEAELEQQLFRELFGVPMEPPKLHEIFFPIHIIHIIEIPEVDLKGESEETCVNNGSSSSSDESEKHDEDTSADKSSEPSELETELKDQEGSANDLNPELIGVSVHNASQHEIIEILSNQPERSVEPAVVGNNSQENEISSETDESAALNQQADMSRQSDETLTDDEVEFIPVETQSSGKLLETLFKEVYNDAPAIKTTEKPVTEIPEVPVAVGVFDRLKYIFGF